MERDGNGVAGLLGDGKLGDDNWAMDNWATM